MARETRVPLPSDLSRAIKAGNLERTTSLLEMDPGLINSVDRVRNCFLREHELTSLLSFSFLFLLGPSLFFFVEISHTFASRLQESANEDRCPAHRKEL
jgi:hypothetical protein